MAIKNLSLFDISTQIHNSAYAMHLPHSHNHLELFYLVQGLCEVTVNDATYLMKDGTVVLIPENTPHKMRYLEGTTHERICINFTLDYLDDVVNTLGPIEFEHLLYNEFFTIPKQYYPLVQRITGQLIKEKQSADIYSKCISKTYFEQFILLLLRQCSKKAAPGAIFPINSKRNLVDTSIKTAITYINKNYANSITLNDISNKLHLNPSYFSNKFKQVNGISFVEYLNQVRINHAQKLLLETKLSVTEIALRCGFENGNYFGDVFRRVNGISPSQYRKIKGNIS